MARLKCQKCGAGFDGRRDAKYCSGVCRARAAKDRSESRSKAQPGASGRRPTVLTSAFSRAIRKVERSPADAAAVALARTYAKQIDAQPYFLEKLGPQYLAVLTQLGMTPNARKTAPTRGGVDGGSADRSALDELRKRRESRARSN